MRSILKALAVIAFVTAIVLGLGSRQTSAETPPTYLPILPNCLGIVIGNGPSPINCVNKLTLGGSGGSIWSDWPFVNPGPYYDNYIRDRFFIGMPASSAFSTFLFNNAPGDGYLERAGILTVNSPAGIGGAYFFGDTSLANASVTPAFFSVAGATITTSSDGDDNGGLPYNDVLFTGGSGSGTQLGNVTVSGGRATKIAWQGKSGSQYLKGDVLTAVSVPGLPTTLTATVTATNVPFSSPVMCGINNNAASLTYTMVGDCFYGEIYRWPGNGTTQMGEFDIGNGGNAVPLSPYTATVGYQAGVTRGFHFGCGGSANGTVPSPYANPCTVVWDVTTNGGHGFLKGWFFGLNSLHDNVSPLFNGAISSIIDTNGVPSDGTGGVNGTAVYTVTGGVCSSQPTLNVTWAAGQLTANSVANAGSCTTLPPNPATLAYLSGTATGWTGSQVNIVPDDNALGQSAGGFTSDMALDWFTSDGQNNGDGSLNNGYVGAAIKSHVTVTTLANELIFTNNGTWIQAPGFVATSQGAKRALATIGTTAPFFQVQGGVETSAIKVSDGAGGVNGQGIYTVSGGTCTTQPAVVATWTAGVMAINSIAVIGSCTVLPTNPATLVYSSGLATGWTGATVNVNQDNNDTQMLHVAYANPGDGEGVTQFVINNNSDPFTFTTPATSADSYNVNLWAPDGAAYQKAVTVKWGVAGSVTRGHVPGRWEVWTTPAGGSLTQALLVQSDQKIVIPNGQLRLTYDGAWVAPTSGVGHLQGSTVNGLIMGGFGSTYDASLVRWTDGAVALGVVHGTTNVAIVGTLSVPSGVTGGLGVTGAITGSSSASFTGATSAPAFLSNGSSPILTTGSCSGSGAVGGSSVGTFVAQSCTGGTYILTGLPTAVHGYVCSAQDLTTPLDTVTYQGSTVSSATFLATTAASDVIAFRCQGY